jgi:hypothetical protein
LTDSLQFHVAPILRAPQLNNDELGFSVDAQEINAVRTFDPVIAFR